MMKKLAAIILAAAFALCATTLVACDKHNDQADLGSASTSTEPSDSAGESSSAPRASRNHGTPPSAGDASLGGEASDDFGGDNSGDDSGETPAPPDSPYVPGEAFTFPPADLSAFSGNERGFIIRYNYIAGQGVDGSNYNEMLEKIQDAISNYETLTSEDKAKVQSEYNTLLKALEACRDFKSVGVIAEFDEKFRLLPESVESLRNKDVDIVNEIAKYIDEKFEFYSALNDKCENFAAKKAKIEECVQYVKSHTSTRVIIAQDYNGDGKLESKVEYSPGKYRDEIAGETNRPTKDDGFFSFSGNPSKGNSDTPLRYVDDKNPNGVDLRHYFNGSLDFTAPCAGTLTLYIRKGKSQKYEIQLDGEPLYSFTQDKSDMTDEGATVAISIPRGGAVHVVQGYYLAVSFSFPDLGD